MYRKIIGMVVAMMFICSSAYTGMFEDPDYAQGTAPKVASTIKVNNTICPVTGDKIDMKNPINVVYKGEIYNLCCPTCIAEFYKDPNKYSANAKKQWKWIQEKVTNRDRHLF